MIDLCGSIIISVYHFNSSPIANSMKHSSELQGFKIL